MKKTTILSMVAIISFNYASAQCNASFTATDNGGGNYDFTNTSTGLIGGVEWWIDWNMLYTSWNANHTFTQQGQHDVCLYTYDSLNNFCDSTCQTVNVSGVGIGSANGGIDIGLLYPNPACERANIPLTTDRPLNLDIEISNIVGQRVYSRTYTVPAGRSQLEIPLMVLPKGSYLIQIASEDVDFSRAIKLMRTE